MTVCSAYCTSRGAAKRPWRANNARSRRYKFEEPQDIVRLDIEFYKGDERVCKFKVTASDGFYQEIISSGTTYRYERFAVNSDETVWLSMDQIPVGEPVFDFTRTTSAVARGQTNATKFLCTFLSLRSSSVQRLPLK